MNPLNRSLKQAAITLAFALAFAGPAAAAGESHEHGHGAGEAKLVLDQGRKWQTDAPLRKGMENIRAALAAGQKDDALARRVNGEVAYIVQNCKLPEDADAQLHLVLAEVIAGVDAMNEGRGREGAERIAKALERYGEFFDHPGWRKP